MIEFKIGKNTWKIDTITIQNYYDIQNKLAVITPTAQLEIISALSGCPIEDLKSIEQIHFGQLWAELVNGPLDISESKFNQNIEFKGKLYGFLDIKKLTIGEIADMDVLSKDPHHDKQLHKMMAILYRPAINITDDWIVVEEYKAETVELRANEFLGLQLEYVHGAISFFLHIKKYSIEAILDSLKTTEGMTPEEEEMVNLTKQFTLELLDTGIPHSTSSQEVMFSKLTRLQDLASTMHSTSSVTQKIKQKKKSLSMTALWQKLKPKDKVK